MGRIPAPIAALLTDSIKAPSGIHFGSIEVTDGIAVVHATDTDTRREDSLLVFDLLEKKQLPAPAISNDPVFWTTVSDGDLYQAANPHYLLRAPLGRRTWDTLHVRSFSNTSSGFIVVSGKAWFFGYPLGPSYVDLRRPERTASLQGASTINYRSTYASLPISDELNLISGTQDGSGLFRVYAIDSALQTQWRDSFVVLDRRVPVTSIRTASGFLVKHDSCLRFLDPSGTLLRRQQFPGPVTRLFTLQGNEVLVFVEDVNSGFPSSIAASGGDGLGTIHCLDAATGKPRWQIKGGAGLGSYAVILRSYLFNRADKNDWLRVNLSTGESTTFQTEEKENHFEVLTDAKTGRHYLRSEGGIYW